MSDTQTLKVTMTKLYVKGNGDSPGKAEFRWNLLADGQIINHGSRKVGDGETILLGNSAVVTKGQNATLTIEGSVTDEDGFLKGADDTDSFRHVYSHANKFGLGSHEAKLSDGKRLDVTLYYLVAKE